MIEDTDMNEVQKEIGEVLLKIWMEYPQLRLCQLIGNCFDAGDLYYKCDEDLLSRLKETYKDVLED